MEKTNQSDQAHSRSRICAISMMLLYTAALLVYDLKEETLEMPLYLLAAVSSGLAGCVLVSGIKSYQSGNRRKCFLQAAAALLLLLAGRSYNLRGAAPGAVFEGLVLYIKYVLVVFWPFAALVAVKRAEHGFGKDNYSDVLAGSLLYILFVTGGIWVLEDVMVPQDWHDIDWRITEMVFLAALSCIVFLKEYVARLNGTGRRVLAGGIAAAVSLTGLGVLIYKSPRLRVILYSLGLRLFDAEWSIRDINWLGYRIEAVRANWSGELEPGLNRIGHYLKDGYAWLTWKKNPLVCLNAEYGKLMILVILILFAAMMFFAGRISYRNEQLARTAWYIRAEFIVAAVFSILNELLLVQAGAGMGCYFPLLGHGAQMLPLLSVLYNLNDLGTIGENATSGANSRVRYTPKWKKAGIFVAALLLFPILIRKISAMPFEIDSYAVQTGQIGQVPEDADTFKAWTEGGVSYYGRQIQGVLEGFGGEMREDQFFFGRHTNGKKDGFGLLKETDGSAWMGRYDNGTMCEGIWIYGDGSFKMTGHSGDTAEENEKLKVIRYEYGDYYYGEVKDKMPEGYGQYYSPGQEYFYMGEFKEGKRNGQGVCYTVTSAEDIAFMSGTWNNGLFHGDGIVAEDPENGFEDGEWTQDTDGDSTALLKDGSWFYKNDIRPCGTHIYYLSDGRWYYGETGGGE